MLAAQGGFLSVPCGAACAWVVCARGCWSIYHWESLLSYLFQLKDWLVLRMRPSLRSGGKMNILACLWCQVWWTLETQPATCYEWHWGHCVTRFGYCAIRAGSSRISITWSIRKQLIFRHPTLKICSPWDLVELEFLCMTVKKKTIECMVVLRGLQLLS